MIPRRRDMTRSWASHLIADNGHETALKFVKKNYLNKQSVCLDAFRCALKESKAIIFPKY